jgi:hypothetical protein
MHTIINEHNDYFSDEEEELYSKRLDSTTNKKFNISPISERTNSHKLQHKHIETGPFNATES